MAIPNSLLLLCICTILLSLSELSLSERCHPSDKKALLQIKQVLNNPHTDVFSSWRKETDCCEWLLILCDDKTDWIVDLSIHGANISGQIPAAVGNLRFLEHLAFTSLPNLSGHIPAAIAKLTHLRQLTLHHNNLSGPIPSFIGDLKHLDFIDLTNNDLIGEFPQSLSKLKNLYGIRVEGNRLTGTIPEWFYKMVYLYLGHNQLTGTVPKSFGKVNNVLILDVPGNKLTGDASHIFSSKSNLMHVGLSKNSFEFDLTKVVFPKNLLFLEIDHNKIYGSLPEGLSKFKLQTFNVSYNHLCGKIPASATLQRFGKTAFVHNKCLCGAPLPAC